MQQIMKPEIVYIGNMVNVAPTALISMENYRQFKRNLHITVNEGIIRTY